MAIKIENVMDEAGNEVSVVTGDRIVTTRDLYTVGVHGVTGREVEEGTLPAGTEVRKVISSQTEDGWVTTFEALSGGRWFAQRYPERAKVGDFEYR